MTALFELLRTNFYFLRDPQEIEQYLSRQLRRHIDHDPFDVHLSIVPMFSLCVLGILIFLVLFNLYFYFTYKERSYLFYVLFQALFAYNLADQYGLFDLIIPNAEVRIVMHNLAGVSLQVLYACFIRLFLKTSVQAPEIDKVIGACVWLVPVFTLLTFPFFTYTMTLNLIKFVSMIFLIYTLWICVVFIRRGYTPAIYLFAAQVSFVFFLYINFLSNWGYLPFNEFTKLSLPLGLLTEGLIFSFGLRHRTHIELRSFFNEQIEGIKQVAVSSRMSSHFIFNCLAAIQGLLLKDDKNRALRYLEEFSSLTKKILENSDKAKVTLQKEIELLKAYLNLEELRFSGKFVYEISVSQSINPQMTFIPPLLIQPFVENSIVHAFCSIEGKGKINVLFINNGHLLECIIEDNGSGRGKRPEEVRPFKKKSMAVDLTERRIRSLGNRKGGVIFEDLNNAEADTSGTRVRLVLPLLEQ